MNISKVGPKPKSIYKKSQWDNYVEDLRRILVQNALASEDIVAKDDYKTFVANYVEREIVGKTTRNAILGITHKLSNMEMRDHTGKMIAVYPIINEYKGHDLTKVWYFTDKSGQLEAKCFSVIPDKSILLLS